MRIRRSAGLVDLYGQTWRTSGTEKMSGDAMDDLLEAKAAHIETGGDDDSTALSWDSLKADNDQVYDAGDGPAVSSEIQTQEKLQLAQQQDATAIVRRNDDEGRDCRTAKLPSWSMERTARTRGSRSWRPSAQVTVADLQAWHDRTIGGKLIVSVSGDFDSAAMEAKLRATFEGLPQAKPNAGAARCVPRTQAGRLLHQQGRREPVECRDRGARNRPRTIPMCPRSR